MEAKKAVTVDAKNIRKKGKKNIIAYGGADVKAKPAAAKTGAEKVNVPVFTKPAAQVLSAAASDTLQVLMFSVHMVTFLVMYWRFDAILLCSVSVIAQKAFCFFSFYLACYHEVLLSTVVSFSLIFHLKNCSKLSLQYRSYILCELILVVLLFLMLDWYGRLLRVRRRRRRGKGRTRMLLISNR